MKSESRIQQECLMWFRNSRLGTNDLFFSVPNEGRNAIEQSRKIQIGLLAGVSDTIIVLSGRVIFCEFKDAKGKQSPKQIIFQQKVEALGHEYWVIRSLDEFKEKLCCTEI